MRTAPRIALAAAVIALSAGARAEAGSRVGFEAWGGLNWHGMAALNDSLRSFNREYRTALPPIREGGGWGLGLRLWPREDVLLRIGFERLTARSQDSGIEFDLGAYDLTLGATKFVPSASSFRYGVGLGLDWIQANGDLAARGATLDASGEGFGGHVAGEALVKLGGGWSLGGAVGYRWVGIDNLILAENPTDLSADYSGPFVRLSLAVDSRAP
jgi:hypothetical protein